jgi:heat shock protein HslJ
VGFRSLVFVAALATAACASVAADVRTLAGTRWKVAAINGQPTPAGPFELNFDQRSFAARMGCNHASGDYRLVGNTVHPGAVAATRMACEAAGEVAVPLMTWEQWGFAVLSQPMQLRWHSAQRLSLSNAAGSIELERQP